jgi:endo-1,4-beta-xylanase
VLGPGWAEAQPFVQHGFEDGTTEGWGPRGGGVIVESVDEAALAGARSLKTTGRSATWNGPSLNLLGTLEKGGVYEIAASFRLVAGQPASALKMTVERMDVGAGSAAFDQVTSPLMVADTGWVTVQGTYSFANDVSALLLYVESDHATNEYYVDEFSVTVLVPPPDPEAPVVFHDFEDGTLQGWGPRGSAMLASSDEAASSGLRSLKTTGRTEPWNGPSLELFGTLLQQAVYEVSADVRLVAGQPATTLKMTIQRQVVGEPDPQFDQVTASADVTDAAWVTISGGYTFTTDVSSLQLYVESPDPTSAYYVDDFEVRLITPPPEEPPDQSGIFSDFEDGTVQGWGPRGTGSVVVTPVTDDAHTGSFSLETTGRTATWNGPSRNALGKMHPGSRYRISVWIKLLPGQAPTEVRVSVQRDFQGTSSFDTVVPNTVVTPDAWTELSELYDMVSVVDGLSVYVETASDPEASFYIDDFALEFVPPVPIQTDIPALKDVLADHFDFGGAIEPNLTGSALHSDLMKMHLNSLTAENAMKFGSLQPAEGSFNFSGADQIADFARANSMTMRGHALVWHQQNPAWLFQDAAGNELQPSPESKALMLQRLEDHIRAVVPRYDDVVTSWDVVNEVIDASQPDGLRRSRWYELTGTDYIDRAFQVAREVTGPNVELYINDFSTTDPAKLAALTELVLDLQARGVPVDGVGHQMHVNVEAPSIASIRNALQTFADLGLDNQVTEMDVSVYTNSIDSFPSVPEALLLQQGYRYRDVFDVYRSLSDSISSVTLWGIADDNTWLKSFPITRLDLPLLFDEQLQAKHAYWGIVDPLQLPVLTQTLDVVEGRARIDGRLDLRWATAGETLVGDGESVSASFELLWDAGHLYLLADVEDASWSRHDRVEIFIDENNAKTTTYEPDDARFVFERFRPGHRRHGGGLQSRVKARFGGYRLEARIPIERAIEVGSQLGFDIRITDANDATVVAWNDFTLTQDEDPSKFGTLNLVGETRIAKAAFGRPVVDGLEDRIWRHAEEIRTTTQVIGAGGASARVRTLWDHGSLYVYAEVTDPILSATAANPWEQDSIEVFVDQNNGKTEQYESDDGQYRVNFENVQSFGGAASAASFETATRLVDGGYVVEAAIALDAVRPRLGTVIGFDLQVNDDGLGDGVRSSVLTWSDPTGESFQDTSRLGVLRFVLGAGHHGGRAAR